MLQEKLKALGFDNVGEIPTEDIPFEPSLLTMCEMNTCGNYGKSYSCPPHVGTTEELIQKAKSYQKVIVFQKIYALEDSFDFEGMVKGKDDFKMRTQEARTLCKSYTDDFLLLGAGACGICKQCGAVTGEKCRFPEKAIASLESYCVQVSTLAQLTGMQYINGQNTVTYFGAVFVHA